MRLALPVVARRKTKGTTIGVQLPLDVDRRIRDAARAAGLTPGVYLADRIVRRYREQPAAPEPAKATMSREELLRRTSDPFAGVG